jgi:hypothetical protein
MIYLIARSADHSRGEQFRRDAILNLKHIFQIDVRKGEREAIVADLEPWTLAFWFENPYIWVANGDVVSRIVVGTDCKKTLTYLKLRYG